MPRVEIKRTTYELSGYVRQPPFSANVMNLLLKKRRHRYEEREIPLRRDFHKTFGKQSSLLLKMRHKQNSGGGKHSAQLCCSKEGNSNHWQNVTASYCLKASAQNEDKSYYCTHTAYGWRFVLHC